MTEILGNGWRRLKCRRGQSLVEFALVLPLLMIVLIGIMEMGRAWNAKEVLTDAAREGARLAVVGNPTITSTSQVDSLVKLKIAASGLDTSQVTISYPLGFHTGSNNITAVEVSYPYQFVALHRLVQFAGFPGGSLTLRTTARMRNE